MSIGDVAVMVSIVVLLVGFLFWIGIGVLLSAERRVRRIKAEQAVNEARLHFVTQATLGRLYEAARQSQSRDT